MKKVAILQPNYIPWKGYFDVIHMVDEFILYDDVQYTKRNWRNRNRIKTPHGVQWLTIPVQIKDKSRQMICEVVVCSSAWRVEHWKTIVHNYARAPYFAQYRPIFEPLYLEKDDVFLSQINYDFTRAVCAILGINTRLTWSSDYHIPDDLHKTARLVRLCQKAGATLYLSGPAGQNYMEPHLFAEAGIALEYMDYTGYPEYEQLYGPFDHYVSVLDLIFNLGPEAPLHMKSFSS